MDAIVEAALRKWPQVPHCYGWLALCARGNWYMRDDRIQHAGPFPQVVRSVWLDDAGRLFLHTSLGHGIVHTQDMGVAALAVEAGDWLPQALPFAQMPSRFGYVLRPVPRTLLLNTAP